MNTCCGIIRIFIIVLAVMGCLEGIFMLPATVLNNINGQQNILFIVLNVVIPIVSFIILIITCCTWNCDDNCDCCDITSIYEKCFTKLVYSTSTSTCYKCSGTGKTAGYSSKLSYSSCSYCSNGKTTGICTSCDGNCVIIGTIAVGTFDSDTYGFAVSGNKCRNCRGSGKVDITCYKCNGNYRTEKYVEQLDSSKQVTCNYCKGNGKTTHSLSKRVSICCNDTTCCNSISTYECTCFFFIFWAIAIINFIAVALLFAFGIYIYHPVNTTLSKLNDLAYPIIPIFVFCAAGFSFILAVVWYIFTPCCEENRTEKRTIYSIFNIISILVIAIITLLFSLNIPSTLDNNWSKNGTVVYWIQDTYDCCGWYNSTDRPYDNCYILNQGCLSIITPKLTNLYYGIMFSAWGIIAVEIFLIIITWLYYCMYKSFNRDESLYYKL